MTATKEKAARPGRVKAAHTTTSEPNDSTRRELVAVIDKNVGEELQVRINEFRVVGLTLSLDLLPRLRQALLVLNQAADAAPYHPRRNKRTAV